MKKLTQVLLAIILFFAANNALAITISEVGGIDEFLVSTYREIPGSEIYPLANPDYGLPSFGIEFDASLYTTDDDMEGAWTYVTADDGVSDIMFENDQGDLAVAEPWAYDFGSDIPEFFVIRIGVLPDDPHNTFVYRNTNLSRYSVINTAWPYGQGMDIGYVQYIGTATAAPVPEPSTLLLLGSSLTGLVFYARRRKRA